MTTLRFFDISTSSKKSGFVDGAEVSLDDLIRVKSRTYGEIFHGHGLVYSIEDFDLRGIHKPSHWEKIMKTVIFCISGQIAARQEVLRGRQIINCLPSWFKKKHLDRKFVLGFLPYVLVGFKAHIEDRFQSDSNRVEDICDFITHIYIQEEVEANSYLCAHRGFAPQGIHKLVDTIHLEKAKKAINFQKAVLSNLAKPGLRKIRWYQQGPTAMASSNMFPEMFIQYLKNGKVSEVLILLEKHFSELERICADEDGSDLIDARIVNLDDFTASVYAFLDFSYGTDWRITNFELSTVKKTPLIEVALNQVLPELRRLSQFYGNSLDTDFLETRQRYLRKNLLCAQETEKSGSISDVVLRTIKAIDWFYYNQLMHLTAKALYEASFYYMWGRMMALQPERIAIGIDRDHVEYQYAAWKMGYSETSNDAPHTSVLYARRNANEVPEGALRDFSLRQFWR